MSTALRAAAVLLLFAALTALLAYPLSIEPGKRALPLSADTRLFLWTLSWDVHALRSDPLHVFDANIFFPERHTLAYSEHLLGSAVLGAPFLLASNNPLLALNAVVLLSCVLSGSGAYFLARRLGIGVPGALAAGVIFAFAPPRFFRLAQAHVATVQWIPFCLGFLHSYLDKGRRRDLLAAAALFTLQSITSGHGGLFLMLAMAVLLAWFLGLGLLPPLRTLLRDLGLAGALLLAVNGVFLVPYLQVRQQVGLHRTIGAVADWAPNAVSFLAAPTHAQEAVVSLFPGLRAQVEGARAYLFPGWLTLLLAALALAWRDPGTNAERVEVPAPSRRGVVVFDSLIGAVALAALTIHVAGGIDWTFAGLTLTARNAGRACVLLAILVVGRLALDRRAPFALLGPLKRLASVFGRQAAARGGPHLCFYAVLVALSLWASLGPGFVLYTVLYRLVPGFDLIRVPSRLTILTLLGLAVLAGAGLERILQRLPARARGPAAALGLALLSAEFAAFPLKAPAYAIEIPAVDRWLASQNAPFAVAELPVADPGGDPNRAARLHSLYMLHSTAHWQPIVNGYSGLVPPRHEALFRALAGFPDDASIEALDRIGVRYVVVHRDLYAPGVWESVEPRLEARAAQLHLEHTEADGRVYSLTSGRAP